MAGIVRRIDELGRIVIPKELRRTMRIRDGEELEMNQVSDNEIIIKKFSDVRRSTEKNQKKLKLVNIQPESHCPIADHCGCYESHNYWACRDMKGSIFQDFSLLSWSGS